MSTAPSEVLMPAAKKKVKKPVATAAVKPVDVLIELAHEVENLTRDEAFAAVQPLIDTVDYSYVRLGGVLAVIRDHEWWKDEDYESFKALLEQKFGMRYRKGAYLIQIYEDLVNSGVEWDKVKSLGWTKLKEISPVITSDNAAEWVAKAHDLTVLQLHDVVGKFKEQSLETSGVKPDDVTTTTTTISFKVHVDQKETIRQAVEKAKKEANTEYDAVALEAVCINYLAGGKVTKPKSLKSLLEKYKPEDILHTLGEIWPDIEIDAKLP
jgi:hypothetical protein